MKKHGLSPYRRCLLTLGTLIFPPLCASCGKEGLWLCQICRKSVGKIHKQRCLRCGAIHGAGVVKKCSLCQDRDFPFCRTEAPFQYGGAIGQMILGLKFGRRKFIGRILGDLLAKRLAGYSPYKKAHFVIPIPLNFLRQWKRGFNQAEILAERISARLKIPLLPALERHRGTAPQSLLSERERRENIKDAFALQVSSALLRRKNVILVDDVFTTGSTLGECAKILARGGTRRIFGAVVARAMVREKKKEFPSPTLCVR